MGSQTAPPACMTALAANTLAAEEISAVKVVLDSGLLTMGSGGSEVRECVCLLGECQTHTDGLPTILPSLWHQHGAYDTFRLYRVSESKN